MKGNNNLLKESIDEKRKHHKEYRNRRTLFGIGVLLLSVVFGCFLFYGFKSINNRDVRKSTINMSELKTVSPNENDYKDDKKEASQDVFNSDNTKTPVKVKGIYISGPIAGTKNTLNDILKMVDETEINSMVIDIKNDSGEITYKMKTPTVLEIGAGVNYIRNIEDFIKRMKDKDIYLIARIVAFKDPKLAEKKPELSLKNKDGTIFTDRAGLSWVNPYKMEVWEYLMEVATEAARIGFDEIQFDYIRFSTDLGMKQVVFSNEEKVKSKQDVITEFTKYACGKLKPLGVYVSADVYGSIISSKTDAEIVGQNYVEMSRYLDYICPMIYPSHYVDGAYGIDYPDLKPYELISKVMNESGNTLSVLGEAEHKAIVRPWLQDFTANWIKHHQKYGKKQIREQIDAVYDSGYEEWILWNGSNRYTKGGLNKK